MFLAQPAPRIHRGYACVLLRLLVCLSLAGVAVGASLVPVRVMAAPLAPAQDAFTGTVLRGARGSQTPQAGDFINHCNSAVNSAASTVGGTTIAAGSAIEATTGCGVAVLMVDNPGQGQFHALFGVAADDTTGQPATVRVRVVSKDGYDLTFTQVTATKTGGAQAVTVNLSNASALVFSFLSSAKTELYGYRLSGAAWTVRPYAGDGSAPPPGAQPVNLAGASYSCNAQAVTSAISATLVTIPSGKGATLTGCGQVTFSVPSGAKGNLVLRYGSADSSVGGRGLLAVRVLAQNGRLLRKALGVAVIGGGLHPLWVDLRGGATVQIVDDSSSTDNNIAVTAAGITGSPLPPYAIHDRILSGGGAQKSVTIDPEAFVSQCNSSVGGSDITVAGKPVFGGTYFATAACGSSSLIFCCRTAATSVGTFHALFGVPDKLTGGISGQPVLTVVVKDKNNRSLRPPLTVRASAGRAGTAIDLRIDRASVLSFAFSGGSGVLYDLRLTGPAAISDLIYPPTAPPVSPPGGQAVDPHDFTLHCNAYLGDTDLRLVGATSLEGWALYGLACGEADLKLTGSRHRWRDFYARLGIKIGDAPSTALTVRLNVLNASGKVIRHSEKLARYGYGTQPLHVSLSGGAVLQILWLSPLQTSVVYAMTAV